LTVRIGTGVSTAADPAAGAIDASGRAAAGLGGEIADLCAVFAGGAHLADPQATLAAVREVLSPAELIG
jgi:small ligand-binding sensory domain FIST